jgi:hypothetical protein
MRPIHLLLLSSLTFACGSTSEEEARRDQKIEDEARLERERALLERDKEKNLDNQIVKFDQAIRVYIQCLLNASNSNAQENAQRFKTYLHDQGLEWLDLLLREAETSPYAFHRSVAAATLGFTQSPRALTPLINVLKDKDPAVRGMAAFGLGELANPDTPIDALVELIEDARMPEETRVNAARALFKLGESGVPPESIKPHWLQFLSGEPDKVHPGVAIPALRALGLLRDPHLLPVYRHYLPHRIPKVREAVAVAMGRAGDRSAAVDLLTLLGPAETNKNVRLQARKALQTLAGGVDRHEDVKEWRKVFGIAE